MSQYILDAIQSLDLQNDEHLDTAITKVQEISQFYSRSTPSEDHDEFKISDPNIIEYSGKEQAFIAIIQEIARISQLQNSKYQSLLQSSLPGSIISQQCSETEKKLKQQLQQKTIEVTRKEIEMKDLESTVMDMQMQLSDLIQKQQQDNGPPQRMSLQDKINARKQSVKMQLNQDKQSTADSQSYQEQINQLKSQISVLEDQNETLEIKVQEQEHHIIEQHDMVQEQVSDIEELNLSNELLTRQIDELKIEIRKHQENYDFFQTANEHLRDDKPGSQNLSPTTSVGDFTQKSMFKNMEADFNLIENEFDDLGLIQDSEDELKKDSLQGSHESKQSNKTHLSSKNQYCISNMQDMEILQSTVVDLKLVESPQKLTDFFNFADLQEVQVQPQSNQSSPQNSKMPSNEDIDNNSFKVKSFKDDTQADNNKTIKMAQKDKNPLSIQKSKEKMQSFIVPNISSKDDMTNDTENQQSKLESNQKLDETIFTGESIYCSSFITSNQQESMQDKHNTEKKQAKLNLGLKLGGQGLNLNLNLKPQIGKGPPIKLGLSGLASGQSQKQSKSHLLDDYSSKNYENLLSKFVKMHHRNNNPMNKVSIHKIIIQQTKVRLNLTDSPQKQNNNQQQVKFDLRLEDAQAEKDFFNLIFLTQIFNQPQFFIDKLKSKDPNEMFLRAKNNGQGHELQFYEFFEWIHNDINRAVYDRNQTGLTGLESSKKAFNINIGQIKFGGGTTKDGKSSKGSDSETLKRSSFGFQKRTQMTSALGGLSGISPGIVGVEKILGKSNLKLGDLQSKKSDESSILQLRKKIQDGTAPKYKNLHMLRKTQEQNNSDRDV